MAKDELESITEDKWDEDIWGIEHADSESESDIPKLVFYFAEQVSIWCSMQFRQSSRKAGSLGCQSYSRRIDCCESERRGGGIEFEAAHADR
jgi:hypothetical protein